MKIETPAPARLSAMEHYATRDILIRDVRERRRHTILTTANIVAMAPRLAAQSCVASRNPKISEEYGGAEKSTRV
jgi:hypothetical protein